jgi:Arc/MetJ-type ribon-helix-helix transcriptional regulator
MARRKQVEPAREGWTAKNIRFPDQLVEAIDEWRGKQPGVSATQSDIIRRAVEEFLTRHSSRASR